MRGIKLGLLPKLLIAIAAGIVIGLYGPLWFCRAIVTASGAFSSFLKFIIPLMILAFVTMGIAGLSHGAGGLLLVTAAMSYGSTLIAGSLSFLVSSRLFPMFVTSAAQQKLQGVAEAALQPYFSLSIPPLLDTLSAVTLAFIVGLCLSTLRGKGKGGTLYDCFQDFSLIIEMVLSSVIVPLLPLYICGTFVDMTRSGETFAVMSVLWKVFLVVIIMHLCFIVLQFFAAGAVSGKNPLRLIANQVEGYMAALGTQSSAATIPVNLRCAEKDGISREIRDFVVPLCANIHLSGSMITITACATAVCLMNQLPLDFGTVVHFIMTLGFAMVAAPGAPGGAVLTALPFMPLIFGPEAGDPNGPLCALMVALYVTQDSFGTACNVSGDNALGVIVDTLYKKRG